MLVYQRIMNVNNAARGRISLALSRHMLPRTPVFVFSALNWENYEPLYLFFKSQVDSGPWCWLTLHSLQGFVRVTPHANKGKADICLVQESEAPCCGQRSGFELYIVNRCK